MQRIPIHESGLVGALYLPDKRGGPYPLVLSIGGFRGGLNESRAEKLSSCGFASLAIAYFGCAGLPASLKEIPIEYCERILDCAAVHPLIDAKRIAIWGVSRGAELSLLLASIIPERIGAIIATVPTSAIYGSIQSEAPAWTYRGSPIGPNAPFPKIELDPKAGKNPESALSLTPYFLEGMKNRAAFHASRIPVEKIRCPLLLFSGEDDQMWPSSIFAGQIAERIQARGAAVPCVHFSYSRAGHAISSSEESVQLHPALNIWFTFGGNPRDNALANADSWEKTVRFLRSWM